MEMLPRLYLIMTSDFRLLTLFCGAVPKNTPELMHVSATPHAFAVIERRSRALRDYMYYFIARLLAGFVSLVRPIFSKVF